MASQIKPRGLPQPDDDDGEGRRKPRKLERRSRLAPRQNRRDKLRPARLVSASEFTAMCKTLFERAGWRCERCGHRGALHPHHRQLLSQGGPDALSNLAALCPECHRWVHAHRRKRVLLENALSEDPQPLDALLRDSESAGWIVPSWADPSVRAMFLHDGRLAVPDDEGGYRFEGRT